MVDVVLPGAVGLVPRGGLDRDGVHSPVEVSAEGNLKGGGLFLDGRFFGGILRTVLGSGGHHQQGRGQEEGR